jgi:hypothetical protein
MKDAESGLVSLFVGITEELRNFERQWSLFAKLPSLFGVEFALPDFGCFTAQAALVHDVLDAGAGRNDVVGSQYKAAARFASDSSRRIFGLAFSYAFSSV